MPKLTRYFQSFALICLSALLPATIHAADISIDFSCSLADAITAANSDAATGGCRAGNGADTITLAGNVTLTARLPEIKSNITVEGNGYTISGNEQHQIFWVEETSALTIRNVTLADGRGADDDDLFDDDLLIGGAIVNWGILDVIGSTFSGNSADAGGAIIIFETAGTSIRDSSFTINAARSGGAIYIVDEASVTIWDSRFTSNSAESFGGAVFLDDESSLIISSSSFTGNSATGGGAITSWGEASITIRDSEFFSNSAESYHGSGGGIHHRGSEISIINSVFTGNFAEKSGGAIFNQGDASVSNSVFTNNSADGGGAINNNLSGVINIIGGSFAENSADSGGAIINHGSRRETAISTTTFRANVAAENGGALHTTHDVRISDSTFTNNLAEADGGAISISSPPISGVASISIGNSLFTGNSAGDKGGAIRSKEDSDVMVSQSVFRDNFAGDEGGAIRTTEDSEVYVSQSVFRDNSARDGGAIYSWSELVVSHSTFTGNSAIEEGGAIANHGTARISSSILADNPGGDCHLGRRSQLLESSDNHISDGSCEATWSNPVTDSYCPPGKELDGVCQIGAPNSSVASE